MSWLPAESWLQAAGAGAAGLRAAASAVDGEAALRAIVARDPRRLLLVVGPPGAGTSRLALALAQAAPAAFYPHPAALPSPERAVAELTGLLAGVPGRPVVVLDGPNRDDGLALAAQLLHTPVHPGLLVVVPCDPELARKVPVLAGRYALRNIMVAEVPGPGAPSLRPDPAWPAAALAPFALAHRRPIAAVPELERLLELGLAAADADSGTAVCLIPEARRWALAAVYLDHGGVERLAAELAREPALAAPALAVLMRLADGGLPRSVVETLAAVPAGPLAQLIDRAVDLGIGAELVGPLAAAGERELAGTAEAGIAALEAALVRLAVAAGDADAARARIDAAVARGAAPADRAALLALAASASGEPGAWAAAARAAAADADEAARAGCLAGLARSYYVAGAAADAAATCAEWLAAEEERDNFIGALAARSLGVELAIEAGDVSGALERISRVLADRRAIADVRGQALMLYRAAVLRRGAGAAASAEEAARAALALETAIDHERGQAACHWLLGDLAGMRRDFDGAVEHYEKALAVHEAAGLPSAARLRDLVTVARERAATAAAGGTTGERPPVADAPARDPSLVSIRRRT